MRINLQTREGLKPLILHDADFVAEGGQAKVYARGNNAYKLYKNPAKALTRSKLHELRVLERAEIIRPRNLLTDNAGNTIGFSMPRVRNAVALARLFNPGFRQRFSISETKILTIARTLRDLIAFVHQKHCLIIDGNELNYLIDSEHFGQMFLIDVDSYQTPNFPACAITPSIRDWHCTQFSELSDWFAFAVIVCQLLLGIHPFRGQHPEYKKAHLETRMRANASIFDSGVLLPATVPALDDIPSSYRRWFVDLFQKGKRYPPPHLSATRQRAATRMTRNTDAVRLVKLASFNEPIVKVVVHNGQRAVITENALYIADQRFDYDAGELLFCERTMQLLLANIVDRKLCLRALPYPDNAGANEPIVMNAVDCDKLLVVENQLYCLYRNQLTVIRLKQLNEKLFVAPGATWNVLANSLLELDNLLVQSCLGLTQLIVPCPPGRCTIVNTPELNGYHIVDGAYDGGVIEIIGQQRGNYSRFILRLDREHRCYRLRSEQNIDLPTVNFVTLEHGVCVSLGAALEIYFRDPDRDEVKILPNSARVEGQLSLLKDAGRVLCYGTNDLYQMTMN